MFRAAKPEGSGLKTGFPVLDRVMDIGSGIVTIRSRNMSWMSSLSSNILVRNHEPGRKSLYLHWVDYHRRYWTLDYDRLARICKLQGKDMGSLSDSTFFIRAFSRDTAETEENWKRIFEFSEGISFAVLDSVSELFEPDGGEAFNWRQNRREGKDNREARPVQKNRIYAIGMFSRLCLMNGCVGVVLDQSRGEVHPFLGEVSSMVLEFGFSDHVRVRVVKHPRIGSSVLRMGMPRDSSLRRWLA